MMVSKSTAPRSTADFSAVASPIVMALGIALTIAPTWARAETQVRGTPQAVVVEARDATIKEILVALTDAFKVEFRSAVKLDKRLTGTYQGTLQQAVSHILKGYDFVAKSGHEGLEITLLGDGKPVSMVGTRTAMKSADTVPAAVPTVSAPVDNHVVPVPRTSGSAPPIKLAQGIGPVLTRPADGAPAVPTPQIDSQNGPGLMPSSTGQQPGAVPPVPTTSSAAPGSPMPTPAPASPTSSTPVPLPSATVQPAPTR
jgi:hypothetical protein